LFRDMSHLARGKSAERKFVHEAKAKFRAYLQQNDSDGIDLQLDDPVTRLTLSAEWSDSPVNSGTWSISVNDFYGDYAMVTFVGPVECMPISALPCPIAFVKRHDIVKNLAYVLARMDELTDEWGLDLRLSAPWSWNSTGVSDIELEYLLLCWSTEKGHFYEAILRELSELERDTVGHSFTSLKDFVEQLRKVTDILSEEEGVDSIEIIKTFQKLGRLTDDTKWPLIEKGARKVAKAKAALWGAQYDFKMLAKELAPAMSPDSFSPERTVDTLT
ncbi:unnamed protein product, partial [marine sediment metagenome]